LLMPLPDYARPLLSFHAFGFLSLPGDYIAAIILLPLFSYFH
jgi:hypothetical protein